MPARDLERRFRVPVKGFRLAECDPGDTAGLDKDKERKRRERDLARLAELQERLYAEGTRALLIVFQAMDAAGKDGTIEHVDGRAQPAGRARDVVQAADARPSSRTTSSGAARWRCRRAARSASSTARTTRRCSSSGCIPSTWPRQAIDPARAAEARVLEAALRGHRRLGAPSGPQRHPRREVLPARLARASSASASSRAPRRTGKNWKFSAGDVAERGHWDAYQEAYEEALRGDEHRATRPGT